MKTLICLIFAFMMCIPSFASADYIGTMCIDINTGNGYYNAYEFAVTQVGENYLLNGKYRQSNVAFWRGTTYGTAHLDNIGNIIVTLYDVIPVGQELRSYTSFMKLSPNTLEGDYTTFSTICGQNIPPSNGRAILRSCQ